MSMPTKSSYQLTSQAKQPIVMLHNPGMKKDHFFHESNTISLAGDTDPCMHYLPKMLEHQQKCPHYLLVHTPLSFSTTMLPMKITVNDRPTLGPPTPFTCQQTSTDTHTHSTKSNKLYFYLWNGYEDQN